MNDLFEQALKAEGITGPLADLARSIYMQESSGGKNTKTSNAGARGGMQIIPGTFAEVADKGWNIDDPLHNARAGIRYLSKLDKMSGGVPEYTAAGYYGGPGGMRKAMKGIAVSDPRNPHAPNTLQYGQEVVARMGGNKPAQPKPQVHPPIQEARVPAMGKVEIPLQASLQRPSMTPAVNQLPLDRAPQVQSPPPMQAMQQAMPQQQVRATDLDYSHMMNAMQQRSQQLASPEAYGPAPSLQQIAPDFRAFTGFSGRA